MFFNITMHIPIMLMVVEVMWVARLFSGSFYAAFS